MVRIGLLVLLLAGCKKDEEAPAPKPAASNVVAAPHVVRRATLDRCRELAAPVRGRGDPKVGDLPVVEMPPVPGDDVPPAQRRLKALQAVDTLARQLERAPRRAALHFQLGQIFLWSLENPEEAGRRLCRALLLAHRERSPAMARYERAVLSAWMRPGMEGRLELALRPGERNLPWREALEYARNLRAVTWEQRAAALDGGVTAQRILRNNRLMARRRTRATVEDIPDLLESWVVRDGPPVWAVVSFPGRRKSRVRALSDRENEVPPAVWATPGPGPRWLLYARDKAGIAPLLRYADGRLKGLRVGISLRQGSRRLYLAGKVLGDTMRVDARALKPENREIETALTPP